jgi:hypothetical protein
MRYIYVIVTINSVEVVCIVPWELWEYLRLLEGKGAAGGRWRWAPSMALLII